MQKNLSSSPYGYLSHIDGLRGLSVFVIILFHLQIPFFQGGFIGVDIFFVISGFLITSIITSKLENGTFSFSDFYAHRIRRIFPALFFMLFMTGIAAFFALGIDQFLDFFKTFRQASLQLSNFHFAHDVDYFVQSNDNAPLLHTWSLGVEEQFYVLWPFLLCVAHKLGGMQLCRFVLVVIAITSLCMSEYLVHTDAQAAFYLLHSRAWQLALGGIVALKIFPLIKSDTGTEVFGFIGLGLILFATFVYDSTNVPGLKAFLPCLGAAFFIYSSLAQQGKIHKVLSVKPIVLIGRMSYSLYLWHWPLIAFYKNYFAEDLNALSQIIILILSFALAIFSYYVIEQPFRKTMASKKVIILAGIIVMMAFVAMGNIIKKYSDSNWRVTYDSSKFLRKPHELDRICSVEGGVSDLKNCIIGPHKESYEVILTGDSHASHFTPAVLEWAKQKNLTVRLFMRGACPTWIMNTKTPRIKDGKVDTYCTQITDDFYKTLETDHAIKYVFLGLLMPTDSTDIRESLEKIKKYNKKIYYLGNTPIYKENPHFCNSRNTLFIAKWIPNGAKKDCMSLDHTYSNGKIMPNIVPFRSLLGKLDIPYFDPMPYMQSPYDEQGRFMFMDDNHMNQYGAQHLAKPLADFIQSATTETQN